MRSPVRTVLVIAVAAGLVALFLRNVDLGRVAADIMRARPEWLALATIAAFANLAVRAYRWQYLLEPLGHTTFNRSFRATAVGFAASAVLPARAGEVIRPYFLARNDPNSKMTTTGAFATIIVERLLDVLAVVVLLTLYVFVFGRSLQQTHPSALVGLKWTAALAAGAAFGGLAVLFAMAGDADRLRGRVERATRWLPATIGPTVAHLIEKFAGGLMIVRRPSRFAMALLLSFPLWLSIAASVWVVARAFDLAVPFTGTFLITAILVLGVAVPTPGAVGGFHAAFRYGVTTFFDAQNEAAVGAAIVMHLFSIGPSLVLGLVFAAQEGLNVSGMRHLASEVEQGRSA